ncbi:MAG: hypothetical protein AB1432_15725 [Bacteroidota bacterium]
MSRIYSQHIFLFPFTIELQEFVGEESSRERLRIIHNKLNNSKWEYKPFQISLEVNRPENFPYSDDEIWTYNEYNYFYDYIRDTLYTKEKSEELFADNKSHVSLYYEREIAPGDEITYYIKGDIPIQFTLKVDNVSLRIFETGIGILSLTLYNTCYKSFEDVLKINDFGRRIYPQFLGAGGLKYPVDATKGVFLCDKIVFNACGINISEEFITKDFVNNTCKYANYIEELLKPLNPLDCKSIIDDRMYTLCWHENDDLMKSLKMNNEHGHNYEKNEKWYQYVFIDGKSPLIAHEEFKNKLIVQTTYNRFTDWGTLFGVSRYSFMCLCGVDPYNDFPYKNIRNHMQKQYYQMAVLLLAQRASIIQFNNEIEKIAFQPTKIECQNKEEEENDKYNEEEFNQILKEVKKLENLDIRVMNFINRMTYNEITPQEQGIELYNMALENMQIPNQLNILKRKINDLHLNTDQILERFSLEIENKRTVSERRKRKFFNKITLILLIFTPLTFYSTFAKIIKPLIIPPDWIGTTFLKNIFKPAWSIVFLLFIYLLLYCLVNDNYSNKKRYPKSPWFYPLRALLQQFYDFKSVPDNGLLKAKIFLDVLLFLLIILSYQTIFNFFGYLFTLIGVLWQPLQ